MHYSCHRLLIWFSRLWGIFALLLCIQFTSTIVAGAETGSPPSLQLIGPEVVAVGQPFTMTVRLARSSETTVAAFETALRFDTTAVHVRSVNLAPTMAGHHLLPLGPVEMADGVAFGAYRCFEGECAIDATEGATTEGVVLAAVTLVGDKAGSMELLLDHLLVVDNSGAPLPLPEEALSLTIQVGDAGRKLYPSPPAPARAAQQPATPAAPDATGDGVVDGRDLTEVVLAWAFTRAQGSSCPIDSNHLPDLNGDGCIDILDLQPITAATGAAMNVSQESAPAPAATNQTWSVNTVADDADKTPGDGVCATATGECSLRAAIVEANAHSGPDTIHFAIPGDGIHTIQLTSPLPTLNDLTGGTTIDAYTQPGAAANSDPHTSNAVILVQIRGSGYNDFNGLNITSPGNVVRGLAFFELYQSIHLYGPDAHDNLIAGNFIGSDALATSFSATDTGLGSGVQVEQGAANNRIGSPAVADRNVISGNGGKGVALFHAGTNENIISNNIIGLTPAGTARLPNFRHGVDLNFGAAQNVIGGANAEERNVISGNGWSGIELSHGAQTTANVVIGNFIGANFLGTGAAGYTGNRSFGVRLEDGASANKVIANVIGSNAAGGVEIGDVNTSRNEVSDNRIGISLNGSAIPNSDFGVRLNEGATHTIIGPNNLIVNNGVGVLVLGQETQFNTITQNSIYANSTLGIDLEPVGVNGSMAGRVSGANQRRAAPTLAGLIQGTVTGSACISCTVELFRDTAGISASAQGKIYVGSLSVTPSGAFTATISSILQGEYVTATATDASGNTSEFSLPLRASEQVGNVIYLLGIKRQ